MADITPIVSLNGELAMPEKVWTQGPQGPQGPKGDTGAAATVTVGTVTTGEPGTDAIVTNSGTESAAVLNFTIPRGATGAAGASGADGVSPTVSTSKSGNVTTITIVDASGTKTATINDGAKGDTGPAGPAGAGVPDGGTAGQLLGKTESGTAWIDPPQSGGGGSVPKPLTYDYMPEGYPKKEQGETVIVENQTISGFQENTKLGVYVSSNSVVQDAIYNKYQENSPTIKILWDGTEYECQYIHADAPVNFAYGNTSLLGVGEDTGEPFLIPLGEYLVISKTAGDSHEIKVSAVTENITPIAEEFLPILTSPNGTKYKITVDDTGTLTATEVT